MEPGATKNRYASSMDTDNNVVKPWCGGRWGSGEAKGHTHIREKKKKESLTQVPQWLSFYL